VFDAVLRLCRERSYDDIGLADIAAAVGVEEEEVRRLWPTKSLVVMESLLHHVAPSMRFPRTGDMRRDLTQQLTVTAELFADPGIARHRRLTLGDHTREHR
ncbi:hypothetical protein OKJ48_33060, partial [Streptomyces kunmingensis]|nr:hypothetical protein [Streptomyces kunmingensis]